MHCGEEVAPNENEARQELVNLRGERDRAQVNINANKAYPIVAPIVRY